MPDCQDDTQVVSVPIAAWNNADLLREAVESALNQTYQPLEVIVVDDGSTDHTADVCASFGDRIRYIHQAKDDKSGATAFRRAIAESRGRFIAPLDQDDRWLPDKIARQMQAMTADPGTGAVFTRFRLIDAKGEDQGVSPVVGPSGDVFHTLLAGNQYCHASALYPRAVLDEVGGVDVDSGIGDWDLWLRISRRYPVIMLPDVLTEYRVHGAAYSSSRRRMADVTRFALNRQQHLLHENCRECRRGMRAGFALAAHAYLQHFRDTARKGDLASAFPSLVDAIRTSPRKTFRPRTLLSVAKSLLVSQMPRRDAAKEPVQG